MLFINNLNRNFIISIKNVKYQIRFLYNNKWVTLRYESQDIKYHKSALKIPINFLLFFGNRHNKKYS